MRARVGADRQTLGRQQRRQDAGRRPLAVGAREVENRIGTLRIGHERDEAADAVETLGRGAPRDVHLQIEMVVEKGEGAGEVHGGQVPSRGAARKRTAADIRGAPRRSARPRRTGRSPYDFRALKCS